jgi:hypothetical protein
MKSITKRTAFMTLTCATLLAAFSTAHAVQPGREGNGGFLYSRTSKKLLDFAQNSLLKEFASRRTAVPSSNFTSTECAKAIDMVSFEDAIRSLTYSYTESSTAVNPDGQEEPRYFQIKDGKIQATRDYFSNFVDTYFRYDEETDADKKDEILKPVRTALIHEGLHLFNYDETESRKCAPKVEAVLESNNADKMTELRTKISQENDQLVLAFLKKNCSENLHYMENEGGRNLIEHGIVSEFVVVDEFAGGSLRCLQRHHEFQFEDPNYNFKTARRALEKVWSKMPLDAAVTLNQYIHFSFEKALPAQNQ